MPNNANVISLPDIWERARKEAEDPSEAHVEFLRASGVVRAILAIEAEWNSPKTSRNRRFQIVDALEEVAHPSGDKSQLVLSAKEREMILMLRGLVLGWKSRRTRP
jgi:hypothetical protein